MAMEPIKITPENKKKLDELKKDKETYNGVVFRLINENEQYKKDVTELKRDKKDLLTILKTKENPKMTNKTVLENDLNVLLETYQDINGFKDHVKNNIKDLETVLNNINIDEIKQVAYYLELLDPEQKYYFDDIQGLYKLSALLENLAFNRNDYIINTIDKTEQ